MPVGFALEAEGQAHAVIYDVSGRAVEERTFSDRAVFKPGPGVYLISVEAGGKQSRLVATVMR